MSLTNEQLEVWRATLEDGGVALAAYLGSPEGQADPELALLTKVSAGLSDGSKIVQLILAKRKVRDLAAVIAVLQQQAVALATQLGLV